MQLYERTESIVCNKSLQQRISMATLWSFHSLQSCWNIDCYNEAKLDSKLGSYGQLVLTEKLSCCSHAHVMSQRFDCCSCFGHVNNRCFENILHLRGCDNTKSNASLRCVATSMLLLTSSAATQFSQPPSIKTSSIAAIMSSYHEHMKTRCVYSHGQVVTTHKAIAKFVKTNCSTLYIKLQQLRK